MVDPAPLGFLTDLGFPQVVSETWIASTGFRMGGTFHVLPEGTQRVRENMTTMLGLGVPVPVLVDLSRAAAQTGLTGDDLYMILADALSLAQIREGLPGTSDTGRLAHEDLHDAVEGDLVVEYITFLVGGWDPSVAHRLLRLGLDAAGAERFAAALRDGRNVVLGAWNAVVVDGLTGVDGMVPALRAWSHCHALRGLSPEAVRAWHEVAGLRAPLLLNAGVTMTEYARGETEFTDEELSLMSALRREHFAN